MNEFFAALYGFSDVEPMVRSSVSGGASELPLASPDSITVTTEFGVVEESGNVTIISASGPSPHHAAFDQDTEEENTVEMTEDVDQDLPELHASLSPLQTSTTISAAQVQTTTEDDAEMQLMTDASGDEDEDEDDDTNDTGEEADIDTDGFDADAESAVLEEFLEGDEMGGGVLTPTATAAETVAEDI
jgi:hypothetical protein